MATNTISNAQIYGDLGLNAPAKSSKEADKLDQEDFLTLLTTQLANQDPFKPMENGDFIAQMAQFGVNEGINDLNANFSTLASSLYSNQALQASALVGRNVLVNSDKLDLTPGVPANGMLELDRYSSDVYIEIRDTAGQTVRTMQMGSRTEGDVPFSWDGKDQHGNQLPAGSYRVVAMAAIDGEHVSMPTKAVAHVDSVTVGKGNEGLVLNLAGIGSVLFSQVERIE